MIRNDGGKILKLFWIETQPLHFFGREGPRETAQWSKLLNS